MASLSEMLCNFFECKNYQAVGKAIEKVAEPTASAIDTVFVKFIVLFFLAAPFIYALFHVERRWKSFARFRSAIDDLEEREDQKTNSPMSGTTAKERRQFYRQSKVTIWPEVFIGLFLTGKSPWTIYRLMKLWQAENRTAWEAMG